ncbi:MAG: hypothetical protein GF417_05640, partial [Candidatus Latescibacteria bacterium]|nr:hypothetical protein [bacterium]MBD3423898.1 hypothetical protein [Candidatus Latescibacterota bacterium]
MNLKVNHKSSIGILSLSLFLLACLSSAAYTAPGSGTAGITPSGDVTAGSSGEWVIEYTTAESFSEGVISVVVPDGWSNPQDSDGFAAGYVTVSSEGTLSATPLSISGMIITVSIDTLSSGETVTVVYGSESISAGGRADCQQSSQQGVEFTVSSDPGGSSTQQISSSPVLNVVADSITALDFITSERSTTAGEITPVMRIECVDQYGNRSAVTSDQTVGLSSGSGTGEFSIENGGQFSDTSSVVIEAGADTVSFYYRETVSGSFTITASADGEAWDNAQQLVTVSFADPFRITVSPQDTTITAGDYANYLIGVEDEFGNSSPLSSDQVIKLYGTGGAFYLTSDHTTPVSEITIPSSSSSVNLDYMSEEMENTLGYLLFLSDEDGQPPALESTSTTVYIEPAAADLAASTLETDLSEVTADGVEEATLTVVVKDSYGNPVSGSSVVLEAGGSGNDLV